MVTSAGTIKKTPIKNFSRPLSRGIIAIDLHEDEYLVGVAVTDGNRDLMLFSSAGKVVRFHEDQVRAMGRTAHGVRGISLEPGQRVISLVIPEPGTILSVTENGFGKRTPVEDFPTKGRGIKGLRGIRTSKRNGDQVGAVLVLPDDEIMLITEGGTLVRTPVKDIPVVGRDTQGVKLISFASSERLAGIERIVVLDVGDDNDDAAISDGDDAPTPDGDIPETGDTLDRRDDGGEFADDDGDETHDDGDKME